MEKFLLTACGKHLSVSYPSSRIRERVPAVVHIDNASGEMCFLVQFYFFLIFS